jgi:ABC-type Fe3+-siderophore transport system permease subunit
MKSRKYFILFFIISFIFTLFFNSYSQEKIQSNSLHDVAILLIHAPESAFVNTIIPIFVHISNKTRNIEEAVVTLIDSTINDTIENWFPLLSPYSNDSTFLFWNIKTKTLGEHVLKIILNVENDTFLQDNEQKFLIKILPSD